MNSYQIAVVLFAGFVTAISLWSVMTVLRSPKFTMKPLWIIGCLCGFVGIGVNWTTPDDILFVFGVTVPVVFFKVIGPSQVVVKTGFPIVSVFALVKAGNCDQANDG